MLLVLFCTLSVRAQDSLLVTRSVVSDTLFLRVYFPKAAGVLDYDFSGNRQEFDRFSEEYSRRCPGAPVSIVGSVSPEGNDEFNEKLEVQRAKALIDALKLRLGLAESQISVTRGIKVRKDIGKALYPSFRYAEAVVRFSVEKFDTVRVEMPSEPLVEVVDVTDVEEEVYTQPSPEVQVPPALPAVYVTKPILALKTNLLFDLATAVNAELEIPVGKRLSVAGEIIFPDWVDRRTNKYCMQASIKTVEVKGWLRKPGNDDVLTGWYAGVYGQWGNFDFQPFTQMGWRVYNGWAAGISAGYAHSINRKGNLRLEYGLGLAYARADYRKYERNAEDGKLITRDDWHYNTVLFPTLTKAKVSLVWLINGRFKER